MAWLGRARKVANAEAKIGSAPQHPNSASARIHTVPEMTAAGGGVADRQKARESENLEKGGRHVDRGVRIVEWLRPLFAIRKVKVRPAGGSRQGDRVSEVVKVIAQTPLEGCHGYVSFYFGGPRLTDDGMTDGALVYKVNKMNGSDDAMHTTKRAMHGSHSFIGC